MKKELIFLIISLTILLILLNSAFGQDMECGNDVCDSNETEGSCCEDCCSDGVCINNTCSHDECNRDSDCFDSEYSTFDACMNSSPRVCNNSEITECYNNDNYCTPGCNYYEDDDCEREHECDADSDCDDNNATTKDTCAGHPRICINKLITKCENGDNFCPFGCNYTADTDCQAPDECETNSGCDDNDTATDDTCEGTPKKCIHVAVNPCMAGDELCPEGCGYETDTDCDSGEQDGGEENQSEGGPCASGCLVNDTCAVMGSRIDREYCAENNELKEQKTYQKSCKENYECITNICRWEKCGRQNLFYTIIEKILRFIEKVFG